MRRILTTIAKFSVAGIIGVSTLGYLLAGLSTAPVESPSSFQLASADQSFQTTIQRAAEAHQQSLDADGLSPAPRADWLTVGRRLSLALVGSVMSMEEIRTLESLPEADRIPTHLDRLLNDPRYHDYWSERWTRILVGNDQGEFLTFRRRRFRMWVGEVLADNLPYDVWVRQMLTAKGLWTDKPEVNFLTATFDSNSSQPDPVRLAARTTRVFLGLRIDCVQCHDDFLGTLTLGDEDDRREGLQTDFHQLAAFFTSAENNGLQGIRNRKVNYPYKYLDADKETDVEAMVPYGSEWFESWAQTPEPTEDSQGEDPKNRWTGDARRRLADWVTDPQNRQFARSTVSHVWALMYGRAATDAVDDLPLDEPLPAVLEVLTDDFIDHQFNLRRLIRLIAMSLPFQLDSRADFEITRQHEDAGAVFPLVRLRGEQVAGAMSQAARVKTVDRESSLTLQFLKFTSTGDFVKRYGDRGEEELAEDAGTITQRLILMNGKLARDSVQPNPFLNTTSHANMFAEGDQETIQTAYLAVLNRYPTETEQAHFVAKLAASKARQSCIEDLMWVLVNSSEFAWNH